MSGRLKVAIVLQSALADGTAPGATWCAYQRVKLRMRVNAYMMLHVVAWRGIPLPSLPNLPHSYILAIFVGYCVLAIPTYDHDHACAYRRVFSAYG